MQRRTAGDAAAAAVASFVADDAVAADNAMRFAVRQLLAAYPAGVDGRWRSVASRFNARFGSEYMPKFFKVGRCRLTVSNPVLKAPLGSALEPKIAQTAINVCFQSQLAPPHQGPGTEARGGVDVPGSGTRRASWRRCQRRPRRCRVLSTRRSRVDDVGVLPKAGHHENGTRCRGGAVQVVSIKPELKASLVSALETTL